MSTTTNAQRRVLLHDIQTAESDAMTALSRKRKFIALLQAAISHKVEEGDQFEGDEGPFIVRFIRFYDGEPKHYDPMFQTPGFALRGPAVRTDGTVGSRMRMAYVDVHGDKLSRKNTR